MGYRKSVDITVGGCSFLENLKRHMLKAELFAGTYRPDWCKRKHGSWPVLVQYVLHRGREYSRRTEQHLAFGNME